jgi:hypothetical protein
LTIAFAVATSSRSTAQIVPSREALIALLGDKVVTETYEANSVAADTFAEFDGPLDSTSTPNGQGPGIVEPGIRFNVFPGSLQIYGETVFGGNSQRLSFSATSVYHITLDPPVTAFGLDMLSLPGYSGEPSISVYDPNDIFLGSFPVGVVNHPQNPTFFGFQNAGGISRFDITVFTGGPILDNVTFERIVPEPDTILLFTAASFALLVGARRSRE